MGSTTWDFDDANRAEGAPTSPRRARPIPDLALHPHLSSVTHGRGTSRVASLEDGDAVVVAADSLEHVRRCIAQDAGLWPFACRRARLVMMLSRQGGRHNPPCGDSMDVPVVIVARAALERNDVTVILPFAQAAAEEEVSDAFVATQRARRLGPDAPPTSPIGTSSRP